MSDTSIELEKEAYEAANSMFLQAEKDGLEDFIITSGYRSREEQEKLYKESPNGNAQEPGCSEQETGLAIDVTTWYDSDSFEDTPYFEWISEHCWEFGCILRYPKGKSELTGINYEPWHYRYVGVEAAEMIRDHNWTLEEYCLEKSG